MEYFIGSITTLILTVTFLVLLRKIDRREPAPVIMSQMRNYYLMRDFFYEDAVEEERPSQLKNYYDKNTLRVFVMQDKAYWIQDNKVFSTTIVDDEINSDEGEEVDMMSMSEVQLKKMLFIIDQLKGK